MDNVINPREFRVFGPNKEFRYAFEMNEETERDLLERMFFLGLDNPKTKKYTIDRYFDLITQTTMEIPIIKLNDKTVYEKTKARFIANVKSNIKRAKSHKLTREEIILLFLAAALSTGMITLSRIKTSIEKTNINNDIRKEAVTTITNVLKENDLVEEPVIGKKGNLQIKKDVDFTTITEKDITPREVFGFISFLNTMYEDVNVKRNFIDAFIQSQTYDNGTRNYLNFNDYLVQNGFTNEKDFYDYCYNQETTIKRTKTM